MNNVARSQMLDVMASDIDRNVFFVPLEQRKKQLEQIPWVESASVMRLLPNRLKMRGHRADPGCIRRSQLADSDDRRERRHHGTSGATGSISFPVIIGMTENEPAVHPCSAHEDLLAVHARARFRRCSILVATSATWIDRSGDVRATVTDPHGAVLVHLGSSNFWNTSRFMSSHVQEWRPVPEAAIGRFKRYDTRSS